MRRLDCLLEQLEDRQLLAGGGPPFARGDLLIGITGSIQWRRPDGTLVSTLPTQPGQRTTGMAFDQEGDLYATGFLAGRIDRFDADGTNVGTFGSGYNRNPESIVFDAAGYAYVGQADGDRDVLKFDASGNLVDSYDVMTGPRGSDWIELAADQRTLYYTSEGRDIKRYDLVTRQQLPDLVTGLPGDEAFQLQLLNDGSVLLADHQQIVHVSSDGKITPPRSNDPANAYSYDLKNAWFNLVLDPDGTSFWTANHRNGRVARFDIATGQLLQELTADPGGVFGLAVAGEIRAATSPLLALTPVTTSSEVAIGQNSTYTILATNNGPGTAVDSLFTFTLPTSATLVSATSSRGTGPILRGRDVTFQLGNLGAGASAQVTIVLQSPVPGLLTSTATVSTVTPTLSNPGATLSLTTNVTAPPLTQNPSNPSGATPPFVTSTALNLVGRHRCCSTSSVVVHFSQLMDASRAEDVRNYRLVGSMIGRRIGSRFGRPRTFAIRKIVYDPVAQSVTLRTRQLLNPRWTYELTINAGPSGLTSTAGIPLANQAGQVGVNYTGIPTIAGSSTARKPG